MSDNDKRVRARELAMEIKWAAESLVEATGTLDAAKRKHAEKWAEHAKAVAELEKLVAHG